MADRRVQTRVEALKAAALATPGRLAGALVRMPAWIAATAWKAALARKAAADEAEHNARVSAAEEHARLALLKHRKLAHLTAEAAVEANLAAEAATVLELERKKMFGREGSEQMR